MENTPTRSSFDPIAPLYHRLWSDWYLPAARPALERLLFQRVPAPARLLDVCCGSGHVTREFVVRGYSVTGVDGSEQLLAIARKELPGATFHLQDVRKLHLEDEFDVAVSTFDSLNHILSLDGLEQVFRGVRACLAIGGWFVFDMNLAEAFRAGHRGWSVSVDDGHASLIRGFFDDEEQMARTELIWFRKEDGKSDESGEIWRRNSSVIEERCYPAEEIARALTEGGFSAASWVTAAEVGMDRELGFGRMFFSAMR